MPKYFLAHSSKLWRLRRSSLLHCKFNTTYRNFLNTNPFLIRNFLFCLFAPFSAHFCKSIGEWLAGDKRVTQRTGTIYFVHLYLLTFFRGNQICSVQFELCAISFFISLKIDKVIRMMFSYFSELSSFNFPKSVQFRFFTTLFFQLSAVLSIL